MPIRRAAPSTAKRSEDVRRPRHRDDGVVERHERIEGKAEVLWGPEVYSYGMREFAIKDPNGYQLAFCEPTDDPPTCDVHGR